MQTVRFHSFKSNELRSEFIKRITKTWEILSASQGENEIGEKGLWYTLKKN